ncbi:hypothetical protein V6N13_121222 [Hibiscus sabdariffa]|uniref:Clathrin heavy chain n=1 Tax=Hibiscus sabdariffa TaxID=183260 RepID=A0ABR2PEE2_9ROSI
MKSHQMPEQVVFWKWISPKMLGLVTQTSVYHWSIEGDSEPVKMFDRTANLVNNQIINYKCDPSEKWLVLIGIAPGAPERPQLVKGNMQLFSVDQQRSQALEAHAASFAQFKVPGNENSSILISFATKTFNADQITSKLHVIELGAQPGKLAMLARRNALHHASLSVLELAWINNMIDFAFPYLLQFIREYTGKVDELIKDKIEAQKEVKAKEQEEKEVIAQQNMYAQLLPAPPMPGMGGGFAPPQHMGGMGILISWIHGALRERRMTWRFNEWHFAS